MGGPAAAGWPEGALGPGLSGCLRAGALAHGQRSPVERVPARGTVRARYEYLAACVLPDQRQRLIRHVVVAPLLEREDDSAAGPCRRR